MIVREAVPADFEAMRAIYNYEVEFASNNFDNNPTPQDVWVAHMATYNRPGDNHPLIVADDNGVICGYASLSPFRAKDGYRASVELSIYIAPDQRGRGLGTLLMGEIVRRAKEDPHTHAVISVINNSNAASRKLHENFGFAYCGTLHQVAFKKGVFCDASYYERAV